MAKKKERTTEKTLEDLLEEYKISAKNLYDLRCEAKLMQKVEKPHLFKQHKRNIARILTSISMKKKGK